jgi:hypothetical protein
MAKEYKDPVEDFFESVIGFFGLVFAMIFFLPFVGIGIGLGYLIWG